MKPHTQQSNTQYLLHLVCSAKQFKLKSDLQSISAVVHRHRRGYMYLKAKFTEHTLCYETTRNKVILNIYCICCTQQNTRFMFASSIRSAEYQRCTLPSKRLHVFKGKIHRAHSFVMKPHTTNE
jgi:hypothetical protein